MQSTELLMQSTQESSPRGRSVQKKSLPRFPKFFQSSEFPSVFNRQLYSRLLLIPPYRRSPTSPPISPRASHLSPQSQLEEQSGGQSDEQSDGQSENQSIGRQSSLIMENSEHSPIIGNSEHVSTTENSEHPDGPPDRPSVGSPDRPSVGPSDGPQVGPSDGPLVEQPSFKPPATENLRSVVEPPIGPPHRPLDGPAIGSSDGPLVGQPPFKLPPTENQERSVERSDESSISSPRPSASPTSFTQSGRQSMGQPMRLATIGLDRKLATLIKLYTNEAKFINAAIHVRCGIG